MAQIPKDELLSAMTILSTGAYKLLMYYYSRNDGWTMIDEQIATAIGSSVRQVKKFRNELSEKEYLLIQRGQVDVYFVGRKSVRDFNNDVVTDEEDVISEPLLGPKHD